MHDPSNELVLQSHGGHKEAFATLKSAIQFHALYTWIVSIVSAVPNFILVSPCTHNCCCKSQIPPQRLAFQYPTTRPARRTMAIGGRTQVPFHTDVDKLHRCAVWTGAPHYSPQPPLLCLQPNNQTDRNSFKYQDVQACHWHIQQESLWRGDRQWLCVFTTGQEGLP